MSKIMEDCEVVEPQQPQPQQQNFYVYLLESSSKRATYVGATTDVNRRLRQHNKELAGGAVATGTRVARGETWSRVCYIEGFPTWNAALQFEWRFKQITRRIRTSVPNQMSSVDRRKHALEILLALDRPTTKAVAYVEWPNGTGPVVVWS
jgi:predicted GIY-YIG superfamily endonuclease